MQVLTCVTLCMSNRLLSGQNTFAASSAHKHCLKHEVVQNSCLLERAYLPSLSALLCILKHTAASLYEKGLLSGNSVSYKGHLVTSQKPLPDQKMVHVTTTYFGSSVCLIGSGEELLRGRKSKRSRNLGGVK